MIPLSKILEAIPLLLLSAGVIALFNGLMQGIVCLADPTARIAFDLDLPGLGRLLIEPDRLWPWLLASGALLFTAGMTTRR
jgi:hypothetical protein